MQHIHHESTPISHRFPRLARVRDVTFAGVTSLALLLASQTARADDCDRPKAPAAQPAQLNAFGCVGIDGAAFAGRYQSIDVFADIASLKRGHRSTPAQVFGKLASGLLPPMLSAALVEWTLAWEQSDDSILLWGLTLRPDGSELLVRLRLPKAAGVHDATIRVKNMSTGQSTEEPIVCTVR